MCPRDFLTEDGQVLLALCSSFGLSEEPGREAPGPLKLSEWNQLARLIRDSELRTPGKLQGKSAEELGRMLSLDMGQGERIAQLLERAGRLALELEGLYSKGMWVVTRVDPSYPAKLRSTLKHQAPTVVFGAGEWELAQRGGIAVVGSRTIDEAGIDFARALGKKAAAAKLTVISGGARGTDRLAMGAALEAGGRSVGVLADSLERTIRQADLRQMLLDGQLMLLTPYAPTAGFSIGAAMGRNKVIYGLSDYGIVVSSDYQTGGTWAGAAESLKAGWCPVFARVAPEAPKGNGGLIKLGAAPMAPAELEKMDELGEWLAQHAKRLPREQDFFGG